LPRDPQTEQRVSDLLGTGFEAAPPHPMDYAEELDVLISTLIDMFEQAPSDILGDRPDADDPAADTWERFAQEVRTILIRKLQCDVRAELA
jgi:hypothetical protein